MLAQIETIDPAQAKHYLGYNAQNRPISKRTVEHYAAQMAAGQWNGNTGEAIKFDTNGSMRDGQHRLHAVIKSNATVQLLVIRNIDPLAFPVLDSGHIRAAADTLAVVGVKNAVHTAALVKIILSYTSTSRLALLGGGSLKFTSAEILDYAQTHDLTAHNHRAAGYYDRWRLISMGSWSFFDWLFSQKDPEAAQVFLKMLASGVNIDHELHPCAYVRRKLNNAMSMTGSRPKPAYLFTLVITAWNHYRNGRKMKGFVYDPSSERVNPV